MNFREKIAQQQRQKKTRVIRNASRGAARAYTVEEVKNLFKDNTPERNVTLFNSKISHIFPLILSLVAFDKMSLAKIEVLFGLNKKFLVQWLQKRPSLHKQVARARGLRSMRNDWEIWGDDCGKGHYKESI